LRGLSGRVQIILQMLRQLLPQRKAKLLETINYLIYFKYLTLSLTKQFTNPLAFKTSLVTLLHTMSHEPEVKATDMEEDMIKKVKEISMNAVKDYKQEK